METDQLLQEAKKVCIEDGKVRVSWIQRKLRIGYVSASRIIDTLVDEGFCEPEFCNDLQGRRIIAAPNTVLHADEFCQCPVSEPSVRRVDVPSKEFCLICGKTRR